MTKAAKRNENLERFVAVRVNSALPKKYDTLVSFESVRSQIPTQNHIVLIIGNISILRDTCVEMRAWDTTGYDLLRARHINTVVSYF